MGNAIGLSARIVAAALAGALAGDGAHAQQVEIGTGSVVAAVSKLRPGEFVWAPGLAPGGPLLLIVNTTTQRAALYRNGVPIAATTVSTGRPDYRTPTGVFTILQKHVEHYSNKYDNAPMPYMQRLTWSGIALHAGQLPGYPASHGCIRLPAAFARLLYGVTRLGMTVVVTDQATTPRVAPTPEIALAGRELLPAPGEAVEWNPERSPSGPLSIVVSAADRRAVVLRNGVRIGSAPVSVEGPVTGTWAYALRATDSRGQHWLRVPLAGEGTAGSPIPPEEWRRFHAPEEFRRAVAALVQPGTTIVVTADSLRAGDPDAVTVIEEEQPEPRAR
ncbi:MAG TPA: L,D-transpeptidase family protein [Sphingomicrobium sp.]|nr:L,D-transpeptidase family protein [Sphingomicrobium sp.]